MLVIYGYSGDSQSSVFEVWAEAHKLWFGNRGKCLLSRFIFLFLSCQFKSESTMQYSGPSIAEVDMTSSGSGYERHLTNPFATIGKKKKAYITGKQKEGLTKKIFFIHSI